MQNLKIELFKQYLEQTKYRNKIHEYMSKHYDIKNVLYPGSFLDFNLSFFYRNVTYVDSINRYDSYFIKNKNEILEILNEQKQYNNEIIINVSKSDVFNYKPISKVDLIFSSFSGQFIDIADKYLDTNGFYLCEDSFNDASIVNIHDNYKLIGVFDNNFDFINKNLNSYFVSNKKYNYTFLSNSKNSPKYNLSPLYYLFQKKN